MSGRVYGWVGCWEGSWAGRWENVGCMGGRTDGLEAGKGRSVTGR